VTLVFAAAIVVLVAVAAVLLLALVRRRAGGPVLREPGRGTPTSALAGTAFAVLLALITLAAFQTYNGAKDGAEDEAVAVVELFRTAGLFPEAQHDELRADFVCYARAVISDEWPAMEHGDTSPVVDRWVFAYRRLFNRLDLSSARERLGLEDMLASARDRTAGRRDRLRQATPSVPTPLWLVLILGGLVSIGLQLAFADPRERLVVQGAMVAGVATLVTAGLMLVSFLDHPYRDGPGKIEPTAMQESLTMMTAQEPHLSLPCDAQGRPMAQ
jgi:hypothetical protein